MARTQPICWKHEWAPLARRFADCVAVHDSAGPVSYRALYAAAAGVAEALRESGIGPGAVVASVVANSRAAVSASLGIALAGAAEAPINPALARAEVAHCVRLSGAGHLVTTRELAASLAGLGAEIRTVEAMPPGAIEALPDIHVEPDAWGRVMFTSGTTGKPKGIVHAQGGRWLANLLLRATLPVAPVPGRAVLLMTPYSHGASLMTQAFLDGGAAVRLLDGVDPGAVRGILERGEVDQIFAPPTVLAKLLTALEDRRIEGIGAIFCGTAPLQPGLYARAREVFGPVVRITYGKTEVFNPITVLPPEETDRWYREPEAGTSVCVGWPASGVEVAIGETTEDDAAAGRSTEDQTAPSAPSVGPVLIRARHMLAATISEDGVVPHAPDAFHRSGDIGFIDAVGRLHLVGRESDLIKTGGYRVMPAEVESALAPALEGGELVVLGIPSDYWGEVIAAVTAGAPAGWQEALQPAVAELSRHKRPRVFAEVARIARNALGKVVRARTLESVLADYAFIDGRYPRLERRRAGQGRDKRGDQSGS